MTKFIETDSMEETARLFGSYDENVRLLEDAFDVVIKNRASEKGYGDTVAVDGAEGNVSDALTVLSYLKRTVGEIGPQTVNYAIDMVRSGQGQTLSGFDADLITLTARAKPVKAKTVGQKEYVGLIKNNTVTIAVGPAGTGKTYLAVAMAVKALREKTVSRIILTRPAVEAGEKLGFLPGDLQDKVDPYLRPLYDALYDMVGTDTFSKYLERGVIEIAPLAYMRGRTLDDAFIILDEAQNTTPEQMKMFLTRLGFGSKAVVTGDPTQTDLPDGKKSGLADAVNVLSGIEDIAIHRFTERDVVRHRLVQKIILAYESRGKKNGKENGGE
ncbi:MAG: PhoH family protein [Lachnospiraceae bacterium]|nr:PhoH family protein [Lachnospiraceae bacterium]